MNEQQLKALNADELILVGKLKDILEWEDFEYNVLTNQYTIIKLNGSANLGDVLQLEFLAIPMYELIAAVKEQTRSRVIDELNSRSINFYDIRKALDMFVDSSWNP